MWLLDKIVYKVSICNAIDIDKPATHQQKATIYILYDLEIPHAIMNRINAIILNIPLCGFPAIQNKNGQQE